MITDKQKAIIKILEDTSDYVPHPFCKRAPGEHTYETFINAEGDSYYIRFHHYKLHANKNIITEDYPYKKVVFKINHKVL